MSIKTYLAPNVQDATRQAVEELGRDAIILKIQPVEPKGLWRVGGRQRVALQACMPGDLPASRRREAPPPEAGRLARAYGPEPVRASGFQDLAERLEGMMARMMALIQDRPLAGGLPDLPPALQEAYAALLQREVAEPLARRLAREANEALRGEELRDPALVRAQLRRGMEGMIRHAGPLGVPGDRARVVALVGPTGVGKTTTIAKLATHFRYVHKRRVGLITIDTYRMGAREQLRQYAELLGLPLAVALTPAELRAAVDAMAGRDLVLIDTAGASQKDLLKLNEVRAFLAAARPDETHLVLSCAAHPGVQRHALEVYGVLGVDRILLTKLDEALALGPVLDLAAASGQAFSYATHGQEVTERIGLGEPARLARLILGEETL